MSFSERLKEERIRLDLSQEAFAAVGGVQKRAQINYESGLRKPDSDYLERVSNIGVDINYIITGDRATALTIALPSDEEVLLNAYRNAPEAVRNSALVVLLSGGKAPTGVDTSKERKGRAAPKQQVVNQFGGSVVGDIKALTIGSDGKVKKD